MIGDIHVMGPYWFDHDDRPTPLGELLSGAKDRRDPEALRSLEVLLREFTRTLDIPGSPLVAAVPPGPDRHAHPVPALAAVVAEALALPVAEILRRGPAPTRLRGTPVARRRAVVETVGYAVDGDVDGRRVLLVDDVILTGTTLHYLAELLMAAGAERVDAVVACRTRLAAAR